MIVKLVEVKHNGQGYSLHEICVNPNHVVCVRHQVISLAEGQYPADLDRRQEFSKLHLDDGQVLTVVGNTSLVENKLNNATRLLKG